MANKKRYLAPLIAGAMSLPASAATVALPSSSGGTFVLNEAYGLTADGSQISVYTEGGQHRYDTDFNATGISSSAVTSQNDAMRYDGSSDGITAGDNGFSTVERANAGSGLFTRGFGGGATQTRALHGHVNIGGTDYTLATTNDASGTLTTAWYNTTNAGLGSLVQTVNTAPMLSELSISSASDITGGTMYLGQGGNVNNLSNYVVMWNTLEKITQFNPTNNSIESYEATGTHNWQDIDIVGDKLYTVGNVAPNIAQLDEFNFGGNVMSAPEPSTVTLLGLGALAGLGYRKKI